MAGQALLCGSTVVGLKCVGPRIRYVSLQAEVACSAGKGKLQVRAESAEAAHTSFKDFAMTSISRVKDDAQRNLMFLLEPEDFPRPESVHQLRVALRRERAIIRHMSDFIALPQDANVKKVSEVLRVLGSERDSDVMKETLINLVEVAGPLSSEEAVEAEAMSTELRLLRERAASGIAELVEQEQPKKLIIALEDWLADPRFGKHSKMLTKGSASDVVPRLLVPLLKTLFLHPGWEVASVMRRRSEMAEGGNPMPADIFNDKKCAKVHALRKKMRDVRYIMELLQPAYGGSKRFNRQIQKMKKLQDILGQLQDLHVLTAFMQQRLENAPKLSSALVSLHTQLWQQWRQQCRKRKQTKVVMVKVSARIKRRRQMRNVLLNGRKQDAVTGAANTDPSALTSKKSSAYTA